MRDRIEMRRLRRSVRRCLEQAAADLSSKSNSTTERLRRFFGARPDTVSLFYKDTYSRQPLEGPKDIRLVKVFSRSFRTRTLRSPHVCCVTARANLEHCRQFTALSYAWGSPDELKPIVLDGATVLVRANLAAALESLEEQDGTGAFWIDAICINQEDEWEKSRQVALMREIYERATVVVVWLGPLTLRSELALRFMDDIMTDWERWRVLHPGRSTTACLDQFKTLLIKHRGMRLYGLDAIAEVTGREWWGRVWISRRRAGPTQSSFAAGTSRCAAGRSNYSSPCW